MGKNDFNFDDFLMFSTMKGGCGGCLISVLSIVGIVVMLAVIVF